MKSNIMKKVSDKNDFETSFMQSKFYRFPVIDIYPDYFTFVIKIMNELPNLAKQFILLIIHDFQHLFSLGL